MASALLVHGCVRHAGSLQRSRSRPAQHTVGLQRSNSPVMAELDDLISTADAQREAYYKLLPWEKKPKFDLGGRPTTLDLRAFIQPFNRGSAVKAAVFARQEGGAALQWRIVGDVGAINEAALTAAVAKQREIITTWAHAFYTDFETDEKLLRLDAAPEVELGWAIQSKAKGKPSEFMNLVPLDTPIEETVRCGFLGAPSRPIRGPGVTPRLVKVELTAQGKTT
eukprot:CAMPEP_0115867586 /NCGR_PEP_ID=MMETSP0287-20121206/20842_1 /TAXON_ID=412157 /ORGANISM="Chrysochromulina rotalis, Strain UIO044" /LENGTH=223 /DNA_ID=CAMNT_0003322191 /DNA_START=11 /DNA_END=682 /DNA_ORIENTATION=+